MVARKFTVLLEPAEEGGFIVKSLELPVATQGETKQEALSNIKEAIEGYLEAKAKLECKTECEKFEIAVEDVEKVIVNRLPKIALSEEEKEEINRSVQEMKKGDYVTLEEIRRA